MQMSTGSICGSDKFGTSLVINKLTYLERTDIPAYIIHTDDDDVTLVHPVFYKFAGNVSAAIIIHSSIIIVINTCCCEPRLDAGQVKRSGCCCCCRPHSTNVLPAESSTRIMWQPTVSPPRWQGKAPLCRDSSRGPG